MGNMFERIMETTGKIEHQAIPEFPSYFNKKIDKKTDLEVKQSPYDENGKLLPDICYESKGYYYRTDGEGRITKAEGTLRLENGIRDENAQRRAGGEDRLPGDQGGHLIGRQFGGSGGLDNLVAMKGELNQGEYKKLEMDFKKALENGQNVDVKVIPKYQGDSDRPSSFAVAYSIDGERTKRIFDNT